MRSVHVRVARKWMTVLALAMAVSACTHEAAVSGGADLQPQEGESLPKSCRPANYGEGEALIRRNAASRHVLVPPGPREMLLCRYWGYGTNQTKKTRARAGKLAVKRRLLRLSLVRALARRLDRSRPAHGEYSCPSGESANLYAVFSYAFEPNVVVEVHLSGCRFAYNGFGQAGFTPPRLLHRLERLTKPGR